MNISYSPVIFTKSSKMMFLFKNDFWTQIRFDKWSRMIETCSFLTTSWNFMLMYVRRLNNYQNSLLSPFLGFSKIFRIFGNFSKRLFRPRAQISTNMFACSQLHTCGKNSQVGKNVLRPLQLACSNYL